MKNDDIKERIDQIEQEINILTKQRATLFDEWVDLVKRNDREFELQGKTSPTLEKKADYLLKSQKEISKKIIKLVTESENLEERLLL